MVKRMGNRASNWKGGKRKTAEGYIYSYAPTHQNCTKQGYVLEHRLVMEKHLNRRLLATEVVHHINEIKNDNQIENLMLLTDSQHKKMHKPRIYKDSLDYYHKNKEKCKKRMKEYYIRRKLK